MRRYLLLLLACTLAVAATAQQHPNEDRGFSPDKVYSFGNIDHVNDFNGNLILTIPLGGTYRVRGQLEYGFALVYNSNVWNILTKNRTIGGNSYPYYEADPNPHANAGMGWQLTLGTLIPPGDPTNFVPDAQWLFEGPDGATHTLYSTDSGVSGFSRDASFLRMRTVGTQKFVDLPDGRIFTFSNHTSGSLDWRLDQISDPFGNSVWIGYDQPSGYAERWTVSDSEGRQQLVYFVDASGTTFPQRLLDHVDLVTPAGTGSYGFDYGTRVTARSPKDTYYVEYGGTPGPPYNIAFLRNVKVPNPATGAVGAIGAGSYGMQTPGDTSSDPAPYYNITGTYSGMIQGLQLPTLGWLEWDYVEISYPSGSADARVRTHTYGVSQRRKLDASRLVNLGTWDYSRWMGNRSSCQIVDPDYCRHPTNPCPSGGPRQMVSILTNPPYSGTTRSSNITYYSVFSEGGDRCTNNEGWTDFEYSAPLTRSVTQAGRYLSTEIRDDVNVSSLQFPVDGSLTTGTLKRSEYVTYENSGYGPPLAPAWDSNRRQSSSRTNFEDDPTGCGGTTCYGSEDLSSWDGNGHYRQSSSRSNFPDAANRTTFTNYYATNSSAWLFTEYSERCVHDDGAAAIPTVSSCAGLGGFISAFNFDRAKGSLLGQRTYAGSSPAANDLLTLFTVNSYGNVVSEKHYGGDDPAQQLSTSNLFSPPTSGAQSDLEHTYSYTGNAVTGHSASYSGVGYKSIDEDFNAAGTVSAVRDTAGVQTDLTYDARGRLIQSKPHATTGSRGGWVKYLYSDATSTARANVVVKHTDSSGATDLTQERYEFDDLGRSFRQSKLMPDGNWSAKQSTFDGLGRVISVSEPESTGANPPTSSLTAAFKTTTAYDIFGRPLSVTAPDGSVTGYGYAGVRTTTKAQPVYPPQTPSSSASTTYTYDALGQLTKVEEPAGPTTSLSTTGGTVTASYAYDAAGHLTSVAMKATDGVLQNRLFSYDGRGLLQWEVHPENGMTTYSYDAVGHLLTKRQAAAGTLFDLNYDYDAAGHLRHVNGRNPNYNASSSDPYVNVQFRPIKEFVYGDTNNTSVSPADLHAGKLTQAIRYNYPPSWTPQSNDILSWLVRVTETYQYKDAAGRKTHRTTDIDTWNSFSWIGYESVDQNVIYNDLDLPDTISYPMCLNCGVPPYAPQRDLQPGYSAGQTTSVPDFVQSLSYWPNGMRRQLTHSNNVADVQTPDAQTTDLKASLPRPASLSSGLYDACLPPVIATQPDGGQITGSTTSVTLTVAATGSNLTYQWYSLGVQWTPISGATGSSYIASPSSTTSYRATVYSSTTCSVNSRTAVVSVGSCVNPTASGATATLNADHRVTLSCSGYGTEPYTIIWYREPDNVEVGRGATVTTASPITVTTSYHATISNLCSSTTGTSLTVTAVIPVSMPSSGLVATKDPNSNQIQITWPSVSGAGRYHLERRSHSGWVDLTSGTTYTSTSYTDSAVAANTTYAYRLWAAADANDTGKSGYSNVDVATTMTFNTISINAPVAVADVNQLLTAVNAVRYAAGWDPVAWSNILGPGQVLPDVSVGIKGAHILALRGRMNEALQALGAPIGAYTDPDPALKAIRVVHLTELQGRAK